MQIINFLKANWHIWLPILIVIGIALAAYLDWQFSRLELFGPRDIVGNGITVGRAKAFDNRSLSLRIERLSNSLAQMKVVDQKFTDNLGRIQAQSSSLSSQTLTFDVKGEMKPAAPAAPNTAERPPAPAGAGTAGKITASDDANKPDPKPEVTFAAGDILNEQLNLASQILNLQTLYERSLTDRLIEGHARLQTVLGFQVSITPPKGFENCVAIVEVGVRVKSETNAFAPVSLVAMIPQEKTYNAQSVSTNAQSIGGSAVASVMNLGYTRKGESRQLFIHRDSDTVAFERNPQNTPAFFADDSATVFGWEFRPVLGRETVSPGVRQMLAVVALPVPDKSEDKAPEQQPEPVVLEIKTRSYWRRYDSKRQTSALKWHWWPGAIDGSANVQTETQELTIPDTKKIQKELAPKVTNITWVNSGVDRATVIVKGENFFPGTRVVTAGKVHREEDGTLTLKSDQALEFETTLAAIASGDSVLSGRFGSSLQLNVNKDRLPVRSLYITRAAIKASRRGRDLRISIDVKGLDDQGNDKDLGVDDLNNLPEPILFVGNEAVPMPYDYWELTTAGEGGAKGELVQTTAPATRSSTDPEAVAPIPPAPPASGQGADGASGTGSGTGAGSGSGSGSSSGSGAQSRGEPFSFSKTSQKKAIRVEAWIPPRIAVTKNSSVMFRVPFCGLDYQAFQPLRFFEPTVTRMGTDATNAVFRISHSLGSYKSVTVELDKVYDQNSPELVKVIEGDGDYRFTVPKTLVSQYQHLVVRIEGAEPFVVSVPPEDKPKPKPTLDLNVKPPQVTKDSIGPAEWTGTNLEMLTAAWLLTTPLPGVGSSGAAAAPTRTTVVFTVYDGGKKIGVYFPASATGVVGKAEVEFQIGSNAADTIKAPLLIAEKALLSFSPPIP